MTDNEVSQLKTLESENAALRAHHAELVKTLAELQGMIEVAMAGVWAAVYKTGASPTDLA